MIGAKSAVTTSYCVARKLQETKRQFLKMIQAIITWHIDKLTHTSLFLQLYGKTFRFIKWEQGLLSISLKTIICRNLKNDIWASRASPAQKLQGLRVVYSKKE